VVREGAARFFLRNGVPLATTGVRVVGAGEAWAAALEQPVLDATAAACRVTGLKLRTAVPAVAVLSAAVAGTGDARVEWRDGPVRAELNVAAGRLTSTRRLPAFASDAAGPSEPPVLVPALAGVGEQAWSYADAYGAAVLARDEPVALRLGGEAPLGGSVSGRRLTLASVACLLAATAAVAAPGVASLRTARIAERELAALGPAQRALAADELELRRVDAALSEIGAFVEARRSPTLFLDRLAEVLPEDVSLVSVRVDSAGGHVVALAPRAASVLAALDSVPDIAALEIVGPVTKEVVGSGTATSGWSGERVTIRFRWAARVGHRR
jgi:hypothetical protein